MCGILTLWRQPPQSSPERLLLRPGKYVLGRSSRCALVVKDKTVSRKHAAIEAYKAAMLVRDLGSSNGTYVDSKRIDTCLARLGQCVCFGRIAYLLVETLTSTSDSVSSEADTGNCSEMPNTPNGEGATAVLSAAEQRIFGLAKEGYTEKHIAGLLRLSVNTVHNHIKAIYRAHCVHSRPELIARLLHWNGSNGQLRGKDQS